MTSAARRAAVLFLVGTFIALCAPFVSAIENETFGVTPFPQRKDGSNRLTFSIPLETGATFEDAIRIYNRTDDPVKLTIYATHADTALDDTISVGLREERARGIASWIDLVRESVQLDAREEVTVAFRVKVQSSDPKPNLGAIVVENRGRGLAANAAERLHVVVRTVPPNTGTTSTRVRSLLLKSPWVFIALAGLVVAGAIVWVGARRSRGPRDIVVPPGELEMETEDAQGASRPVIKRLGATDPAPMGMSRQSVLDRVRASAGASRKRDNRPLLDDALLVEIDPDEEIESGAGRGGDEPTSDDKVPDSSAPPRPKPPQTTRDPKPATPPAGPKKAPARSSAKAKTRTAKQSASKTKGTPKRSAAKRKPKEPGKAKQQPNFIPLKDL